MLKLSEMYTGEYLRKEHLIDDESGSYKTVSLKIRDVQKKEVAIPNSNKTKEVAVVFFEKAEKGMCLNAGNRDFLIKKFGNRPKLWVGQDVTIGVDPDVKFKGKVVGGLVFKG